MHYKVTRGEKGKVEVKVEISAAEFSKTYGLVLTQLGQDAKIAGFRPSNVPDDVVEIKVGANKILNQAASQLISKHLSDILKKENLNPLDSPKIAIDSLAKNSPFAFTSSFVNKPQVSVGQWKQIKVKRVKAKEITEKDVNESIKNIFEAYQKQKATKGTKEPEGPEEESEDERQPSFASSYAKAPDDEKATEGEGKFIYDAHGNKLFLGKSLRSSSSQGSTAGLKINNEFAKKIGARDLVHLGEIVKKDLETLVADQVEAKIEQDLFEALAKISQVEVSDALVDAELDRMIVRLNNQLETQGKSLEDYLKEQNTTLEALRVKWRPQAQRNVHITLTLDEIGKQENVKVTQDEVQQAMKDVKQTNLSDQQKEDLERYLAYSIFQVKTLDLVKKTVAS